MTLSEAIAEVKRTTAMDDPWSAEAIVLQAVASGDLIPRTDAEMAVALVVQRAGEVCDLPEHDAEERNWRDGAALARRIRKAILALAPADAMADVERMKAERDKLAERNKENSRMAEEQFDRAEAAEVEAALMRAERDELTERLQSAMMDGHDLAKNECRAIIQATEAEVARLRDALIAARQVVYQSSIDRTQPEDAEAALWLIDAALKGDTP